MIVVSETHLLQSIRFSCFFTALSGPGPSTYAPVIRLTKPMAAQYSIVGKLKDKKGMSGYNNTGLIK